MLLKYFTKQANKDETGSIYVELPSKLEKLEYFKPTVGEIKLLC